MTAKCSFETSAQTLFSQVIIIIIIIIIIITAATAYCGPGSSVGIATDYSLEGSGSNPDGDDIFRQSRPALGPTQSPVNWVPGLFPGGKVRPGRAADHTPPSRAAVMEE